MKVTLKTLEERVEQLRTQLDALALENKDCLATEQILELSQQLDLALDQWAKLKAKEE